MMEVVAVNVGGWKRVKRIELEHNGISDEEFEVRKKEAGHIWVFGEPLLWLDRRVVKTVSAERIRRARFGLRNADCGLRNADCGLRNADCGLVRKEVGDESRGA